MGDKLLTLYTGPNCSLCDKAEAILYQAGLNSSQFEKIDVTGNLELKKSYGLKIPVLAKSEDGQELFWPFELESLLEFLSAG